MLLDRKSKINFGVNLWCYPNIKWPSVRVITFAAAAAAAAAAAVAVPVWVAAAVECRQSIDVGASRPGVCVCVQQQWIIHW